MSKNPVELTGAEWPVIKVVWETEPCTAPAVREKLLKSTGWTYSTVRTIMDRMVLKGVLKAKKEGKITIYHSAVTRRQAQRGELFYTLKHAFNGALAPLVQCLLESKDLDENELAKIEALVHEGKNRRKIKIGSRRRGGEISTKDSRVEPLNQSSLTTFQGIGGPFSLSQRERAGVRENLPTENPAPVHGEVRVHGKKSQTKENL